ncbi:MAG: proline iminopeptidase-family hydrolase [Bifidobacteriaceae bacterium]|jgi:proline iminopeptidase/L-proline amide hydrolase|nr:proline iminopeptidase-family hydrolase [Bifidobacteriaceae bacterium]
MSANGKDLTVDADLKVVEGKIPFKGYETWYQRVGESEPGKAPLLTFHGGPGCKHNYLKSLDGVALYGREVIYYDQLGCGNSPTPYLPDLWGYDLWLEEIDVLRDALGLDEVHILGQSWGGMLAMLYATKQPRPKGVKSMTIASSPADISAWLSEANRLIEWLPPEMAKALKEGDATGNIDTPEYKAASDEYYRRHVCNLDPMPEWVRTSLDEPGPPYEVMQGHSEFVVTGKMRDYNVVDKLPSVTIPTLVTSGLMDENTPLLAKQVYDLIPGAEWEMFMGTHCCHAEVPEEYNKRVEEFFEKHDAD